MKYTVSNTINKPLDAVIQKFTEPEGAMNWMEGLQKIDRHTGTPYEAGAKADFHFIHKGREMKISEEILEANLPGQIKFLFHSPMGSNEVEMKFEKIDDNSVKQINNTVFHTKGMMKIMGFLFKGMFKKQSVVYLDAFKKYAES